MRSVRLGVVLLLMVLVVSACVAGQNPEVGVATEEGVVAGFLLGLWHGIIAPVTFIISLFTDNVNLYEVHNNGNWYDFGFVVGAGILFGGGFAGRRRR
jgi:choline-glycine betaine transporter